MKFIQIIQRIIDYGLMSTLILFPLSINIALFPPKDPNHALIAINLSIADLIIGLVFILWILKVFLCKEWKRIEFIPKPVIVFVGVGVLSVVNAFSISLWVKEIIQLIEYFVIFYIVVINNLKTIKLDVLKNVLFVSLSIILFIAFIQSIILDGNQYLVRGLFENRNILGIFLCISSPLIYVELIHSNELGYKIWMFLLIALTIVVLTSGSAILSILVSLCVINWLKGKKIFLRFLLIVLMLGILYPFIMPKKNVMAIKEFLSIYEQGSICDNYSRRLALLGDMAKNNIVQKKIGENNLKISAPKYFNVKLPDYMVTQKYDHLENSKQIKNQYLEMQASLNVLSEYTLLGVGLGNFQNNIGKFYFELPKVNTAEPNQHNGYLIVGASMGIIGLAFFLWMILFYSKNSYLRYKDSFKRDKIFYLGLFGSFIACIIENCFSVILTSALLTPLIFLFYFSCHRIESGE